MTPREALAQVEGLGYRLALRPGGLRLTGGEEPTPLLLAMIHEHRDALMDYLKSEAQTQSDHESSLASGRLTIFPAHLLIFVHPSIRSLLPAVDEKKQVNRVPKSKSLNIQPTPILAHHGDAALFPLVVVGPTKHKSINSSGRPGTPRHALHLSLGGGRAPECRPHKAGAVRWCRSRLGRRRRWHFQCGTGGE